MTVLQLEPKKRLNALSGMGKRKRRLTKTQLVSSYVDRKQ